MLCPASCRPLAEQFACGARELLQVLQALLGFGVEVAHRKSLPRPLHTAFKVSCMGSAGRAGRNQGWSTGRLLRRSSPASLSSGTLT